jgi:hypothetical protein
MRSLNSLAEIQGIGRALAVMPAFGDSLTTALRLDLGDWRDAITWPKPIFTDPIARTEFYVDRGFNPSLISPSRRSSKASKSPAYGSVQPSLTSTGPRSRNRTIPTRKKDLFGQTTPMTGCNDLKRGCAASSTRE